MKNAFFFLAFFLILISFCYSADVTTLAQPIAFADKFVKVRIDDKIDAWTMADVNPDFLIASDAYWYGSNTGQVKVVVYLKTKLPDGYFIGIETKGKGITVKQVTEDKEVPAPQLTTASDSFIYDKPILIPVDKAYKITFDIEFNARDIGFQEEFDIILYDNHDREVARLDPYLSGYTKRIPFYMDTTQLSATVTNDHAILVYLSPADTNFWSNHSYADQNGVDFTYNDGDTTLDWYVEQWDNADHNAWVWIEFTEDFASGYDANGFLYVGGAVNQDNSDGTAAFPSDYNAMYLFNSTSGATLVDATGHKNGLIDDGGWTAAQLSGGAYNFAASRDANAVIGAPYNTDYSILGMVKPLAAANDDLFEFDDARLQRRTSAPCVGAYKYDNQAGTGICGHINVIGEWQQIAIRYKESTTARTISWNGADENSANSDLTITSNTLYIGKYWGAAANYLNAYLDTLRYFNRTLSADEVKLLYLSDSKNLITFGGLEEGITAGIIADFTYNVKGYLNQEAGISSVTVDFNDASIYSNVAPTAWKWMQAGVQFSTDQNTSKTYSSSGDYNICYDVNAVLTIPPATQYFDEDCDTITIAQSPQGMDIIADATDYNSVAVGVDFNSTAVSTGIDAYYWLYDSVVIGRDENIFYQFTAPDQDVNICIMMQFEDINKIHCETFYVAKYTVKIPLLQSDFITQIKPFTMAINTMPLQYDTNNHIDSNFFLFSGSDENFSVTIDVNSDYYQQKYNANTKAGYAIIQPYMVDKINGVEVTVYTIDNINNRISLPGVAIESYVSGLLVESVTTDGAGTSLMHFQKGTTYTLKFYYGGTLKVSQTYVPTGATNLFAYIDTGIISGVTTVGSVRIEWVHSPTNEIPINYIIKIYQVLSPISTKIDDINLTISHDDNGVVYNAYITGLNTSSDYNLSYDVNIAGLSQFKPLKVRIQIWDVNGVLIKDETSQYTFVNSTAWTGLFQNIRTGLGEMLATMLSCFVLLGVAKSIVRWRQGEDNNWVFVPIAGIAGMMVFLGLLTFVPFILALLFAASLSVWEMRQ